MTEDEQIIIDPADVVEHFVFQDFGVLKSGSYDKTVRGGRVTPSGGNQASSSGMLRQLRDKATEDGFTTGHADGWAAAQREWQARLELAEESVVETQAAVAVMHKAIADLHAADAIAVDAAAAQAVELAYRLAEAIVERDVQRDSSVLDAVHRACALLAVREGVTVYVSPDQVDLVKGVIGSSGEVRVVGDPAIKVGGCVAEAGSARVDTQWESALAKVRDQFGLPAL